MKKIIPILAAVLSAFATYSCTEEAVEAVDPIKITETDLAIPAKGGDASVKFKATGKVVAVSLTEWLDVTSTDSTVTATAPENDDLMSRYGQMLVKCGEKSITFTVQQYGQRTSGFTPEDIVATAAESRISLAYDFDEKIEATADVDWITLDLKDESLDITIAANTTQATKDNRERTGKIAWRLGYDKGEIAVSQRNIDFMQNDANWTLTYDGVVTVGSTNMEAITNTVAASGSGKYAITYVAKSDVTSSGLSVADYVDVTLSGVVAGQLRSGAASLYEDTATANFALFSSGNYYAFAIGFDDSYEATGHYAFSEFTRTAAGASYEAWLGEWTSKRGTATDTWVISEKVKGESYYINGIEGLTDAPIEAEYDSDNASLVVKVQEGVGKYQSTNYGELDLGFYGALTNDSGGSTFYKLGSVPYTIFTATFSDSDNAAVAAGTITTSSGTVTPQYAKYIGTSSDSKYVSIHNNTSCTPLPTTISRVGGSGGGDQGGGSGSEAYKSFLGNWSVTPANTSYDAWTTTFSTNVADSSYYVSKWQGWDYDWLSPIDATFNSDGTFTFLGGTGVKAASNVQVDDSGENFDIYYVAHVVMDGKSYVITSGTGMYNACKGTLGSDGNITLTGLEVKLSDGNTYTFDKFGIAAINSGMTSIYTYNNAAGSFPVTMTKASSSSSVKSLSVSRASFAAGFEKASPSQILRFDDGCEIAVPAQAL